jgi:general secretion pathway protein B
MSFILDALRKSEIERQRQSGPSMAEFPVARQDRRLPIALLVLGFLLAGNLAALLFFLLRSEPRPAEPGVAPAAAQVAAAPAATGTAPPPAAAPAPADPSAVGGPAPGAAPQPVTPGTVTYAQSELDPYGATLPPEAPDPTLLPAPPPPSTVGGVVYSGAPRAVEDAATVESQTGLPPLSVDLHVFADDPAKRAVFINGRRYTQGATIAEGPTVEEITREGAVLSYRGRRFLLPRL